MKSVNNKDRLVIEDLSEAYAYHQMVTDSEGNIIDCVFLEVNPAFETMTGLKRENIIGRKVTEMLPDKENSSFEWVGIFGQLVQTGETIHFEQYCERYYRVTAYPAIIATFRSSSRI